MRAEAGTNMLLKNAYRYLVITAVLFCAETMCPVLQQTYGDNSRHASAASSSGSNVRETDKACYILFPLDNPRAPKSWYDARSVCLYHGGDLATDISPIIPKTQGSFNLPLSTGYWIGLQQQTLVWFDNSGIHVRELLEKTAGCVSSHR